MPVVQRVIEDFPEDEIVRYRWPLHRATTLWTRAETLLQPVFRRTMKPVRRQAESEVLFQGEDFAITDADVKRAVEEGRRRVGEAWASMLDNEPVEGE
jgi:hypothetical protein